MCEKNLEWEEPPPPHTHTNKQSKFSFQIDEMHISKWMYAIEFLKSTDFSVCGVIESYNKSTTMAEKNKSCLSYKSCTQTSKSLHNDLMTSFNIVVLIHRLKFFKQRT